MKAKMKTTISIFLTLCLAFLTFSQAQAEDQGGRYNKYKERKFHRMLRVMRYSSAQKKKAVAIRRACKREMRSEYKTLRQERKKIRQDFRANKLSVEDLEKKVREMQPRVVELGLKKLKCRRQILALAAPVQKDRLRSFMNKESERSQKKRLAWKEKRKKRYAVAIKRIGLSSEQSARMNKLRDGTRDLMKETRPRLKEAKQKARELLFVPTLDETQARETLTAFISLKMQKKLLRTKMIHGMREILTPDQRKKLRRVMRRHYR